MVELERYVEGRMKVTEERERGKGSGGKEEEKAGGGLLAKALGNGNVDM